MNRIVLGFYTTAAAVTQHVDRENAVKIALTIIKTIMKSEENACLTGIRENTPSWPINTKISITNQTIILKQCDPIKKPW